MAMTIVSITMVSMGHFQQCLYLEFKKIHYKMCFEHVQVALDMLGLILLGMDTLLIFMKIEIFIRAQLSNIKIRLFWFIK